MILFLGIVFVILGISAWLYSMYLSWKVSTGAPLDPVQAGPVIARIDKVVRAVRKVWYRVQRRSTDVLNWLGSKAKKQLITWFPSSKAMFERHNELAGLQHGPSSYFLKRISSTPPKETKTRLPRGKKML